MKSELPKAVPLAVRRLLAPLACGLGLSLALAQEGGNRVLFPTRPPPVYNTNTPGPWSRANLISVPVTAGGSAVTDPDQPGVKRYPYNRIANPPAEYRPAYALAQSSFGHNVTGNRPDFYLGDPILPPDNPVAPGWYVNWSAMRATNITGGAIFEASVQQLYATAGGPVTVAWVFTDGQTNQIVTRNYLVSGTPASRPHRIYWTEPPYNAPTVNLQGRHVKFHWNNDIPAPAFDAGGNLVRGLQVDSSGSLHAAPGPNPATAPLQGMVVMQYFKTGDLRDQVPGGVVVVEVRRPEVNTLNAEVSRRLLPKVSPYGYRGLDAHVNRGTEAPGYVYRHKGQYTHSPKNGWVFAVRPSADAPWMVEIYWEESDLMGSLWPYEVDWYAAQWPADAQPFVRGSGGDLGADVYIARSLSPKLMDAQEPPGHARLSSAGVFHTTGEGHALLEFTAEDNVWFQAVRSVWHTNQMTGADPMRWPVGTQLQPALSWEALRFDGSAAKATVANFPGFPTNAFTLECWFAVSNANNGRLKPILSRNAAPNGWEFLLAVDGNGWLKASLQSAGPAPASPLTLTGNAPLDHRWYHAAFTVGPDFAALFVDGELRDSAPLPDPFEPQPGPGPLRIGWGQLGGTNSLFNGCLDEIRIWSCALSPDEVGLARAHALSGGVLTNLLAYYPIESDGTNSALADLGGHGYRGAFVNAQFVSPGAAPGDADFSADHGYLYDPPRRAPYNVARYRYATVETPDAPSYIFGINDGQLEVWWARRVQQPDMPAPVYIPAWACAYRNVWATNNAPEIVLASGRGSPAFASGDTATIYGQNDADAPGYNPNEEHALIGNDRGGWVAYALRDDLNTAGSSPPFVLVDRTDPLTRRPLMEVFRVIRTNAAYPAFNYAAVVGDPLWGPHPLDLLANVPPTAASRPHAWRDRQLTWWAVGAGHGDNETAVVMMTNYYPMQPGFWFPLLAPGRQPPAGTPIPWLPVGDPVAGTPAPVAWTLAWPTNAPAMRVGQTLTRATGGLPTIWDQASVDIAYQQSVVNAADPQAVSVRLFDPTIARDVAFPGSLADYGFTTGPGGNSTMRKGLTFFQNLPPDLSDRFFYDPTRQTLRFIGQLNEPATGRPWLLVNRLSARQHDELKVLCTVPGRTNDWNARIDNLATSIVEVAPNDPFDHLALAAVGRGAGFVTLAFNNSTNLPAGDPISLQVIRVRPELDPGFLIPLKDAWNLLSEQMNILFSESFAGDADQFEFQWVATEPPSDGTVPALPGGDPGLPFAQEDGLTRIRIGGQGATLRDLVNRFFTVRYRAAAGSAAAGIVGPGWSPYADYALAEGWVQRVLFSITPFEQRLRDLENNPADTRVSMIRQAGRPYAGDVALNLEAINDVGLIELYQTVLNRARRLSLDLGIDSPAVNQQLLLAASRLQALYMLLGNEAYADALDPTIGFGSQTVINTTGVLPLDYGAFASSLFCFANQVPTLLDEELALLRGRAAGLAPGVTSYPYYNRLLWNFTRGLDAGEVAYAVNYNIQSPADASISAETAAALYPQGHGDAYGHYLSALKGYYQLLRHPHFNWGDPAVTALLLGYQTINADYDDETRFAETAAALARTGVEIARRTSRQGHTESAVDAYPTRVDPDSARGWGVTDWIGRTGMGAFYNWAVAQSLIPTSRVEVAVAGDLRFIDRTSVKATREIATQYRALQRELDQVNQDLNPLGLARDAIAFDISPAEIDAGRTHFEQVYDRAVGVLANAQTTFDAVQQTARLLRQQAENAVAFEAAVGDQEQTYQHQLIQIFGYPYADDIGPDGTYAQGYDGPDLFHFMYMDLAALGFNASTEIGAIWTTNYTLSHAWLTNGVVAKALPVARTNITFHFAANGLVAKPAAWAGSRRAEGSIQRAYRDFLGALLELRAAELQQRNDVEQLTEKYAWYDQGWYPTMVALRDRIVAGKNVEEGLTIARGVADAIEGDLEAIMAYLQIVDAPPFVMDKDSITGAITAGGWGWSKAVVASLQAALEVEQIVLDREQARDEFTVADQEMRMAIMELARQQRVSAAALAVACQKLNDAQAGFVAAVAEGGRLLDERESFRTTAAARTASSRYHDMAFRIFRNDALARYGDAFDLAARYTFLAARAYDYETGLLPADRTGQAGGSFMDDIVRARTLGRVVDGRPALGATGVGEPGLADILARLSANWTALRGRLGFNNPETGTGRFSLRTELFRIAPGEEGDALWRQQLAQCRVDDLLALPEFRRYCLPFASQNGLAEVEPGLVIPFSSTIDFAKNFFGRDLAGGDNAYDSSHFATKIRSVGVWFTDYDRVTDGSQRVYLANQPRVYLIPVGEDVMRSPAGAGETLRRWQVLDQAIPIPFPIGGDDLDQPDWIALYDSLSAPWGEARRYPSLRAYHDRGFNVSEMTGNARLVGRSVWNTRWLLIVPAGTLHHDRAQALDWFIGGASGTNGVSDIKLFFQTYSLAGN